MDDMVDVAGMMLTQPRPQGRRVGIITLGGGWGVIATDKCASNGLTIPVLDKSIIDELDKVLPAFWSRGNPVDLVAPGKVDVITDSVKLLAESGSVDAVLVLGLGYMTARAERLLTSKVIPLPEIETPARYLISEESKLFAMLTDLIKTENMPIIPVIDLMGFDAVGENNMVKRLDAKGVMAYPSPDTAIAALAKFVEYSLGIKN
jgi:acyl-CoA synthetase (NDP forming)